MKVFFFLFGMGTQNSFRIAFRRNSMPPRKREPFSQGGGAGWGLLPKSLLRKGEVKDGAKSFLNYSLCFHKSVGFLTERG